MRKRGRGRPKTMCEELRVTLPEGTIGRIDAARDPDEDRLSVVRAGIDRELARRARRKKAQDEDTRR